MFSSIDCSSLDRVAGELQVVKHCSNFDASRSAGCITLHRD